MCPILRGPFEVARFHVCLDYCILFSSIGCCVQMISSHALDIVGFQEVRLEAATGTNNQIGQLAHFLPHYQVLVTMHTC